MSKFCNVFTVKWLSHELPIEYLNQDCVVIEIIQDCANVLFDDESIWFIDIHSIEPQINNTY